MYKLMLLIKRKPGVSKQEFVDYYESSHSKLGERFLRGNAIKYTRRYLFPLAGESASNPPFDVAMEMWFKDEKQHQLLIEACSSEDVANMIAQDEAKFQDREKTLVFRIEEHESDLKENPRGC